MGQIIRWDPKLGKSQWQAPCHLWYLLFVSFQFIVFKKSALSKIFKTSSMTWIINNIGLEEVNGLGRVSSCMEVYEMASQDLENIKLSNQYLPNFKPGLRSLEIYDKIWTLLNTGKMLWYQNEIIILSIIQKNET